MNRVLRHAHILTEDTNQTIIEDGALVIEDHTIAFVGPDDTLPAKYTSFEMIDASDCLLLPSLINCHTHTGMLAFRSLGDDVADRLRRFLLPMEKSCMTEALASASAALAIAEMQLSGIGCAVDMYYYEKAIVKTASLMGFRLFGGETIIKESPCNSKTEHEGLTYAELLRESERDNPFYTMVYAPHAPYSVSSPTLKTIHDLALKNESKWTMHLSEMDFELEQIALHYGMTPIAYLESLGVLSDHLLAVHCIHTTDEDLSLLAKHKTAVVHCPGANAKAGKGVARVTDMLQRGIPVCLGTDGPSSGNTLDMFTQMKLCAILQKNAHKDRTLLQARQVVPMVTTVAAKALGMEDRLGSLEVGKDADILVLGLEMPNAIPCFDPYSALIYSMGVQNVRHLFTRGEWVVKDHQLTQCNLSVLKEEFLKAAEPFFREAKIRLKE
ncbi:MAG TPA: amidohydrolase [Sphaerochaeta sp.]|nr:amidohydrolase [Sphaerochaeta sp.]